MLNPRCGLRVVTNIKFASVDLLIQVVQAKVPDLHALDDISEYVAGGMGGGASDSEMEDEDSKILLPDDYVGRGNVRSQKR